MQTGRGGSVQFTFSVQEGFGSALLLNLCYTDPIVDMIIAAESTQIIPLIVVMGKAPS